MQKLVKTGKYIFTNNLIGRVTTNAKSDLNKNYWSIEFVDFNPVKLTLDVGKSCIKYGEIM